MEVGVKRKAEEVDEVPGGVMAAAPATKGEDPLAEQEPKDPVTDPLLAKQDPEEAADEAAEAAEAEEEGRAPRAKKGTEVGKAAYEDLLGSALGGGLYDALAGELSQDAMAGHGAEGVEAGFAALAGQLGELDEDASEKDLSAFGDALGAYAAEHAEEWLQSEKGEALVHKVGDWVDANPGLIVTAAILAAGGAYLADLDIPEIKQKVKISDELSVEIASQLGSLQSIAFEEVRTKIAWASNGLKSAVEVTRDEEGDYSGKAEVRVGDDERHIEASAEVSENEGLEVYGVRGLYTTDSGSIEGGVKGEKISEPTIDATLTRKDGSTTRADGVAYDAASGVLTLKNVVSHTDEDSGAKVEAEQTSSSDGSRTADLGVSRPLDENTTASAGVRHEQGADGSEVNRARAALAWAGEDRSAEIEGEVGDDRAGQLKARATRNFGKYSAEGNAGYEWSPDGDSYDLGLGLGYEDAKNRMRAGYSFASEQNKHRVDAFAQHNLREDLRLRGTGSVQMSDLGTEYKAGAHGAYFFNKDAAVIGGGSYERDVQGRGRFIPEVGAQFKGVPVKIGYDPAEKSFRVGITVGF